jgi:endonuclease-3
MESLERMTAITRLMRAHYGNIDEQPREPRDPYRTLIGCVLSHRTRDENSSRAARNLFEEIEGPLDILAMNQDTLKTLIRCSGFFNQKARSIVAISQVLVDDFGGMVPDNRETLMGLPGVGPKTADIVLSYAFGKPAIAVDVHVSRVARRLGLAPDDAGPEGVKEALESLVPPDSYRFVDNAFVRHGKGYCRNSNPRCSGCFLNELCGYPSSQSQ